MKRLSLFAPLAAVFHVACAGGSLDVSSPDEHTQEPIIGGTTDTGDSAVVGVFGAPPGAQQGALCTGTLIAPTWVLTAAHCVDPATAGDGNEYTIFFVNDMHGAPADRRVKAKAVYWDTAFSEQNLPNGHDIGLVELSAPAPADVKPVPYIQSTLPGSYQGGDIRLVGFGLDNGFDQQGQSAGIKRQVTVTLNSIGDKTLDVGKTGMTSCNGDSGGPAFVKINGVETLVGVTSYGMIFCLANGFYTRVDLYTDFINSHVGTSTCTPSCAAGQQCGPDGCGGSCGTCGDGQVCTGNNTCQSTGGGCPNESEGNDDPKHPNPLCAGDSVTGTIGQSGDIDWYSFDVAAGKTYTIMVENVDKNLGMTVYKVSAKTGALMKVGDGALFGDVNMLARRTPSGGTYYVKLYGVNGFSSQSQYGLYVSR
jgi:trypsin/pre-peptidase